MDCSDFWQILHIHVKISSCKKLFKNSKIQLICKLANSNKTLATSIDMKLLLN